MRGALAALVPSGKTLRAFLLRCAYSQCLIVCLLWILDQLCALVCLFVGFDECACGWVLVFFLFGDSAAAQQSVSHDSSTALRERLAAIPCAETVFLLEHTTVALYTTQELPRAPWGVSTS